MAKVLLGVTMSPNGFASDRNIMPGLLCQGLRLFDHLRTDRIRVDKLSRISSTLMVFVCFILSFAAISGAQAQQLRSTLRFEISFPPSISKEPITGRAFVMIAKDREPEPRLQVGSWIKSVLFFGVDVNQLKPGDPAVIDIHTLGFPSRNLEEIPPGDYYVQALLNIYTQFHRSDGHVIWAHMDQWEGQQFNISPGNLFSDVQKVHLDPKAGYQVKLSLTEKIPPIHLPENTTWVRHVKLQSKLLTKFWGHPIYLGATVLLPKDYDSHPDVHYPVVYVQGHFQLYAPTIDERAPFTTEYSEELVKKEQQLYGSMGLGSGYEFYQAWKSENFPRLILISFQHPTPYFDDSYAVNSANNGPYGDAIMTELIPYVEEQFRIIRKPYARVLSGGSTGGWESLALQVYHPEFFGGTWTLYPDPIDFRRYDLVNIYNDENAFYEPGHEWLVPERYFYRTPDGQPQVTVRQLSQLEAVLGSHGRSAQQLDIWQAVYGPVGADGYPKDLWDKKTGAIDHEVANYMREQGYDLRYYIESNWPRIGRQLVGKLHIYCGDMDDYYLNLAVYLLEDFLKNTNPYYAGSFTYGRPMKGHGWQGMTKAALIELMAGEIMKNAPEGEDTSAWKYH